MADCGSRRIAALAGLELRLPKAPCSGNWQDLGTQSAGARSALPDAALSQFRTPCSGKWNFQNA
eukprot:3897906-Alexandrium_andersonii.AAC.1